MHAIFEHLIRKHSVCMYRLITGMQTVIEIDWYHGKALIYWLFWGFDFLLSLNKHLQGPEASYSLHLQPIACVGLHVCVRVGVDACERCLTAVDGC